MSDIPERAVRRVKQRTSAVLLKSGLEKMVGWFYGMLLLSAKMFKTLWQMGNHLMKGDLENHLKKQRFRLAPW